MTTGSSSVPLVSVVVATRNRAETLSRALTSIADQDAESFECVVADDGSDAEQFAKVRAAVSAMGSRFRLLPASCDGPSPATSPSKTRNRGVRSSASEFVAFLDDDDFWLAKDHLSASIAALRASNADMAFADMRGESSDGVSIAQWFPECPSLRGGAAVATNSDSPAIGEFHAVSLAALTRAMRRHYPHPNTLVVRRSLVERIGGFWEKTQHMEDVNFILRLADQASGILFRDRIVASFTVAGGPSNFRSTSPTEHALVRTLSMSHIVATAKRREVIDCAAALLSWNERELALSLLGDRQTRAARRFACRSFCSRPSAGALKLLLRCLFA